jgi:toxin-antitoxin system PIN domain toxin
LTYILDVNVLIALIDPKHIAHLPAHEWFSAHSREGWATCPITKNGVVRIVGSPQYPNSPGIPVGVIASMRSLLSQSGHIFWPDDLSLMDSAKIDASRLLTTAQVTDSYLLALARAHGGKLATLDRRSVADAVVGGVKSLQLIS